PFVYFIRIKIYDKYVHGIDLEAMDAELKSYSDIHTKKFNNLDAKSFTQLSETNEESDLSDETPKKTLQQLFSGLRLSLRSLF
ncbi:hypothetical protein N9L94_05910, partial [Robiginitalea sp.]|nr:hypothetical protein [Robiginitalea sp.]